MCDPISMIGFGLSAAGAVEGLMGQKVQADAQSQLYARNRANAIQAFSDTNGALTNREMQEQVATSQKLQTNALATQAAQATAVAAGAAGGVQGLSLDGLLGDYGARSSRAASDITTQEGWDISQVQSEKVGAADQQVSRINSVQPGNFGAANFMDAGLRIGSAGITADTSYMRNQYYGMGGNPMNFGMPSNASY